MAQTTKPTKPTIILAIDPGETSGYIRASPLAEPGTLPLLRSVGTWCGIKGLTTRLGIFRGVDIIVMEDYRVYAHKARTHISSRVLTAQVIGAVKYVALTYNPTIPGATTAATAIPIHYQSASQAKNQWPDERLRLHYHRKRLRQFKSQHILDALRHLLVYIENHTPTGVIISPNQEAI